MPTYEYECRECKEKFVVFQKTVRTGDEVVECPSCQSGDARRVFSSFGVGGCFGSGDSGCRSSSGFG